MHKIWPKWLHFSAPSANTLLLAIPVMISLAIMLIAGPYFETAIFVGVQTQAPSIANPDVQTGYLTVPTLSSWFGDIFTEPYLLIGLLSVLGIKTGRTPLQTAISMSALLFLGLITLDLYYNIGREKFSSAIYLQNCIANLMGSIAMCFVITFILYLYEVVCKHYRMLIFGRFIAAMAVLSFGVLISITSYFSLFAFFQPIAYNFRILTNIPSSGYLFVDPDRSRELNPRGRTPVPFLPKSMDNTGILTTGFRPC